MNKTDKIVHCGESTVCNISSYGLLQCATVVDGCASCVGSDLCCKDWTGKSISCRPDSTYTCCADGTVCPWCTTDCCSSNSYTGETYVCPAGSTCKAYDNTEQSLTCTPPPNACAQCSSGTECCAVDFYPEFCASVNDFCCRDGVACPKSQCNASHNIPPGECCSGDLGLFCPGYQRGYDPDEIYCTWSTNIDSCSKYTRKLSCSECETGECCQDISGKFTGCIDKTRMTCCVLDGTNCPNSLSSICSLMGPQYDIECCSVVVGDSISDVTVTSCPPLENPLLKYCSPNGGCQANPRPPLPPEWSGFPFYNSSVLPPGSPGSPSSSSPTGSPGSPSSSSPTGSPGSPSSGMTLDMFWGGVLSGILLLVFLS